jgi:zinc protease
MTYRRLVSIALSSSLASWACGGVTRPGRPPAPSIVVAPAHAPILVVPADDEASAPAMTDGDVTTLRTAGVSIIVRRVPSAEVTTSALFIRGGASNWTSAEAGIEDVALTVVSAALKDDATASANVGVEFGSSIWEDHGELFARGPTRQWQTALAALLDGFARTEVSEARFASARSARLNDLRAEFSDVQDHLARLGRDAFFKGHGYAINPIGTPETLARLTAATVGAHLAKLRQRSRLLLVVAGDVDAQAVAVALRAKIEALPRGTFKAVPTVTPAFAKPTLALTVRDTPLPFLFSVFPVPQWHEAGFAAGLVTMEALDAAMFEELRSRRALSYFQYAALGTGWAFPAGRFVIASKELPLAFTLVQTQIERLGRSPLSDRTLRGAQQTAMTKFFQRRQTTDEMAFTLGRVQIRSGDWRWSRVEERLRKVSAADVQAFARQYLVNFQTTVLGPADLKLDPSTFAPAPTKAR